MSTPKKLESDEISIELALRPTTWKEYVGQDKVKENLRLIIDAAKHREENCDHILFHGQAGLGKTTLAYIVSKEMGVGIKTTSGPALEKMGDIAAILSNLEKNEILFIDEAHRLNKFVEETLYPAMESRKLHLVIGKGVSAKIFSLDLPPFTIIAATTRANLLSSPLRSRFGATFKLDYYNIKNIGGIIKRSAGILNAKITAPAIEVISKASRFTPRVANRLLKRARDYAQINSPTGIIDEKIAKNTLKLLEIDELGLDKTDRELLFGIINKFQGGPVGLKTIAAFMGEDVGAIESIYEPFLMRLGMINRTPTGRVATQTAYEHLKTIKESNLF